MKAEKAYDQKILGVISTNPGQVLGKKQNDDDVQLALNGRVPVKVSSSNGDIHAGDQLTSSSIPGVAMKATGVGQVIGKALEDYSNSDTSAVGKIMVFMNLSWYDSQANLVDIGDYNVFADELASQNGDQSTQSKMVMVKQ